MIEERVEEEVKEERKVEYDDEGNPIEPAEGVEETKEAAAPAWKPTDYRWTKTNGRAKNLP